MTEFRSQNIPLNPTNYVGLQFYFVTICSFDRHKIFVNPLLCSWLVKIFRAESARCGFSIHAYCLMPDHFHFLAEGVSPSSDLLKLVKSFKLKTSRVYHRRTSRTLWQRKFFDHILRPRDVPESVSWYIWMNPVRKGLAPEVGAYPFSGSFTAPFPPKGIPSTIWAPPKFQNSPLQKAGATTA